MKQLTKKLTSGIQSLFNKKFKILAYHGITDEITSPYDVSINNFREQMAVIEDEGYCVIGLDEAVQKMYINDLSSKYIVITFDDGYESIYNNACSILTHYKYQATLFIPTGLIGENLDSQQSKQGNKILTYPQLIQLKKMNFQIGSHSVNHVDLTSLSTNDMIYEIEESYKKLVEHFGMNKYYFSYPYGLFNTKVRNALAKSQYSGAVCFGNILSNWTKNDQYLLKREKILAATKLDEFKKIINPKNDFKRTLFNYIKFNILFLLINALID